MEIFGDKGLRILMQEKGRDMEETNREETVRIVPVGDEALLVEFGERIDETINRRVHLLKNQLDKTGIRGIREMLPTYRSLLIFYDPALLSYRRLCRKLAGLLKAEENQAASGMWAAEENRTAGGILAVPCCYGGRYGPDLADMEKALQMTADEIVRLHCGVDYKVYMIGFLPGFPYLGGMDERIRMPRLAVPRTKIPARSVGIGDSQTGVYPVDSPGGWRLIGKTPLDFYCPQKEPPVLCRAGTYIRFVPVDERAYGAIRRDVEAGVYRPEYVSR